MKRLTLITLLAGLPLLAPVASAQPLPAFGPGLVNGFAPGLGLIILAERRFDPFVQRLMAERSLRALPLYGGQLFYLVPTGVSRGEEAMQIRYLEVLLRERGQRESESGQDDGAAPAATTPQN
ncbi:MAG: hypothetical protein AAGG11_12310 [Pseudomonadota bacterium]